MLDGGTVFGKSLHGHRQSDGGNTTSDVAAALTLTLSLDRVGEGSEMDSETLRVTTTNT